MQRTDSRPISALIKDFIKANRLEEGLLQCRVYDAWDAVVKEVTSGACTPERAAALTSSKSFKGGVLSLKINSSTVRMQFRMNSASLLKMVNEKLGEMVVTKIVFS